MRISSSLLSVLASVALLCYQLIASRWLFVVVDAASFLSSSKRRIPTKRNNQHYLLSSKLPPHNEELSNLLQRSGLFVPKLRNGIQHISDLGYYGWVPKQTSTATLLNSTKEEDEDNNNSLVFHQNLNSTTAEQITENIHLSMKPRILTDEHIQRLNETLPFEFTPIHEEKAKLKSMQQYISVDNKYPYGQTTIASLYAAVRKGVNLRTINFVSGSYTLFFLATGEVEDDQKFIVARVPGSKNLILATRYKEYTNDFTLLGCQFERFLHHGLEDIDNDKTKFHDLHLESVVHLQLMNIAGSKVLLAGEVDAMDEDENPLEIKCGRFEKRYFRTLFQMISSGSLTLIRGALKWRNKNIQKGSKHKPTPLLMGLQTKTLRNIVRSKKRRSLGRKVHNRMKDLRRKCNSTLKHGEVKEVVFQDNSDVIRLKACPHVSIRDLFPTEQVCLKLLEGTNDEKATH